MNNIDSAIKEIEAFLKSDEQIALITGTNQFKKHILAMYAIDKYFSNARVLFRINALGNIPDFISLKKQPRAGEFKKIGNNYYCFDSLYNVGTQSKTLGTFDFAIVYPIDGMLRDGNYKPIEGLHQGRSIGKIFLCSCADKPDCDYSIIAPNGTRHIIYDAIDENPMQHNNVSQHRTNH